MSEVKFYVLCKDNCEFEAMSKEQILTAIEQAVSTGEIKDVDTGFVTTIKEANSETGLSFWIGTQAEYNALTDIEDNKLYIISDDTSYSDLQLAINKIIDGRTKVQLAANAVNAENATNATNATNVQGVDLSASTKATFGDYVVSKKKLIQSNSVSINCAGTTTIVSDFSNYVNKPICLQVGNAIYIIRIPNLGGSVTFPAPTGWSTNRDGKLVFGYVCFSITSNGEFQGEVQVRDYMGVDQSSDFNMSFSIKNIYEIIE